MMFFMILSLWALILCPSREAWAQKSLPTVRIGIEAVAGTNSHYYVTKQLGLFQKQGLNLELISFPGGTVGIQSLLAGDLQFATADGNLGLTANLRGASLYFIAGMINTFPFSILSKPEVRTPQDLRGKKIVISRYGSSSDTAVRAAVENMTYGRTRT
jgi:NitT/TauT family transport system substrate-binding protein